MAIYHFSGTIISRSQGRSAVACAAYRAAEKLHDEKYDRDHDYSRKQDVAHKEILLPDGAPAWMQDREKLWNVVEAFEKRKDAQLAREFNFALPRELSIEQNILLAREFVQQQFVNKGMVADLCVHNEKNDKMESGEFQPHAHVMLTMREVNPEGFGQKVRAWNGKENLLQWRAAWSEYTNRYLNLHDHDVRIDHRSLKDQGIELEPQHKIGASVVKERKARFEDHQRIARENGERIFENPHIALSALTHQQSTFTHQDLARFVSRHTLDADQFQKVFAKVKSSKEIVHLGRDTKNRDRFTSREMLVIETSMLEKANQLSVMQGHGVAEDLQWRAVQSRQLTTEQETAFNHVLSKGSLKCVVGYAGTGKSYLLGAAKEAWESAGYQVRGATLSGIAAEGLEGSSGIESRTVASRFYHWDHGKEMLTSRDILVVDEAGMLGSRQLERLLREVHQAGAKMVLVGDPQQLQAIEAGAGFRALGERFGYVELTDIRRQQESWQREATKELALGNIEVALNRYRAKDHVHEFDTNRVARAALVQHWNDVRISHPEKTQLMLAYTRKDVQELNRVARQLRHDNGELGQDRSISTERGERLFAKGDRIYFLKNDRALGVMNGTLGTVEFIRDQEMGVRLDRQEPYPEKPKVVTFSLTQYNQIDHGYAATIHKTQSVTVDRSYILASKHLDAHATYVGLSRHRESADLFYSREEFPHEHLLAQQLGRLRQKDVALDYPLAKESFGQRRGVEKSEPHLQARANSKPLSDKPKAALDLEQLRQRHGQRGRADFSHFKSQFEAKNPARAQQLQESLMPRYERLAKEAAHQFNILEKAVKTSRVPNLVRDQLNKYAVKIAKQPEIMDYLKNHNVELSKKIEGIAIREKERERDRGIER